MDLLYFAWVRQKIGVGRERLEVPPSVATVADLLAWLSARGPGYAAALGDTGLIRVAVNQEFATLATPVAASDEVAFFPPVTGG